MDKPKLLLVDDDEDIRVQMKWALATEYEVTQAADRVSAMAAFNTSSLISASTRSWKRIGTVPRFFSIHKLANSGRSTYRYFFSLTMSPLKCSR